MEKSTPTLSTLISTIVVDSGSTTNMLNDCSAFITFNPTNRRMVQLTDDSDTPILGYSNVVILLNKNTYSYNMHS